jgi:hypothetical protein
MDPISWAVLGATLVEGLASVIKWGLSASTADRERAAKMLANAFAEVKSKFLAGNHAMDMRDAELKALFKAAGVDLAANGERPAPDGTSER